MDDTLSNKIAAGEVVERPASIVKELVENAIDAASTQIEILLEEAGLTNIRITDNGKGMSTVDAVRAFERHATSKIMNEHDLFRIRTLGFRGEALASIASVSKVYVWTSDGETSGTEVEIEGGKLLKHKAAALRKGTDIQVAQLFYNTPARLKYMKTIQTELGHTIGLVNRLALSHPLIAFKLMHNGQVLLHTTGSGNQLRVISDIYGTAVAKKMVMFTGANADYSIDGYVSLPEMTRASRNYMTLIVNGRWVQSNAINRMILDAYHTYLPIGRFPIVVLNIEGDPLLTDVNVHPSKQHIRMSKEGELFALIKESIAKTIQKQRLVPEATRQPKVSKPVSEQTSFWTPKENKRVEVQQEPFVEKVYEAQEHIESPKERPAEPLFAEEKLSKEHQLDSFEPPLETELEAETSLFPKLFPVGQVHGTYIIAQNEDGFYMIDQHAAQERIKYEFFREKVGQVEHKERQLLLLPIHFHYSADEKSIIKENISLLEEVGIYLEEFGPTAYVVREFPTWFPNGEENEIIEGIVEQVLEERKVNIAKLREEAAIMMSCKKSIKANHHLTMQDMERLVEDLAKAENPFTCPHGRPVLIHFTTYEIEKMFKRVM